MRQGRGLPILSLSPKDCAGENGKQQQQESCPELGGVDKEFGREQICFLLCHRCPVVSGSSPPVLCLPCPSSCPRSSGRQGCLSLGVCGMLHTVVSVTGWPLDSITALLLLIILRIRKISQLQQDSGLSVLSTDLWYLLGGGTALLCLFTVHNFANGLIEAQVLLLCKPLSVGDICADRIIFFLLFFPSLPTMVPLRRAGL